MHCDIVIPAWNQMEMTKNCLESVLKNTDYPYRVIVIDNGSESETANYLKLFAVEHADRTLLIRNEKNAGYITATNQGMEASTAEYVCLLSNDTLVYENWLSSMVEVAELEENIGLINPASNHFNMEYDETKNVNEFTYMGMGRCIGFCVLVKRKLIDKIGFLDTRFGLGYGDDIAYSAAAVDAGFKCVLAKKAFVFHYGKATFGKDSKAKAYARQQGRLAMELLMHRPRIIALLSEESNAEKNSPPLKLLNELADRGLRCKVIVNFPLKKAPFEHMYLEFREKRSWISYLYGVIRFLVDRKTDCFVTDNKPFFYFMKMTVALFVKKKLLFLGDEVYDSRGHFSNYPGDIMKFHKLLNTSLGKK